MAGTVTNFLHLRGSNTTIIAYLNCLVRFAFWCIYFMRSIGATEILITPVCSIHFCKALKNGAITLFDPTCPVHEFPSGAYWQHNLQTWLQENQLMAKSSDWNLRWQQDVNTIMNAGQFTVPTEIFKNAVIDTSTVNYRDMMINVGAVFNNL